MNPPSYFLRFPDRPSSRIIALPASLGGAAPVDGLKWIASFPGTSPRASLASAVLILNDPATGYPYACLEASVISAARTAAMAVSAADSLSRGRARPRRLGIVGTGLIARYVHTFLEATGWTFDEISLHDTAPASVDGFRDYLERSAVTGTIRAHETAAGLVAESDLVLFTTVASEPHLHDLRCFAHAPLVLHLSLRDLAPEILLGSTNIVDDVEHCLKADTSPHLAEQPTGTRDFLAGAVRRDGRPAPTLRRTTRGVLALRPGSARPGGGPAGPRRSGEGRRARRGRRVLRRAEPPRHRPGPHAMPLITQPSEFDADDVFVDLEPMLGNRLYLKCEGFNFAGSIKLKAAAAMIAAAEAAGRLRHGSVLIESSSGNLGVALAMIATSRGYRWSFVTDNRCNLTTRRMIEALGGHVKVITEPAAEGGLLGARIAYVKAMCAANDQLVWLDQYRNAANWQAHGRTTGPEILLRSPTSTYSSSAPARPAR